MTGPLRQTGRRNNRKPYHKTHETPHYPSIDKILTREEFNISEPNKIYEKYCIEYHTETLNAFLDRFQSQAWFTDYLNSEKKELMSFEPSESSLLYEGNTGYVNEIPENYLFAALATDPFVLRIRDIPIFIRNVEISEECGNNSVNFGYPDPTRYFERSAWIVCGSEEELNELKARLEAKKIKTYTFNVSRYDTSEFKIVVNPPISQHRLSDDQSNLQKLVGETQLNWSQNPRIQVDQMLLYLRKVHFYCYYCGVIAGCEFELAKRCGNLHLSQPMPVDYEPTDQDMQWARALEEKTKEYLSNESLTPPLNLTDEINQKILKVDEEKFRCSLCAKLFRGAEFVSKHIGLKHSDFVEALTTRIHIYNKFIEDRVLVGMYRLYLDRPNKRNKERSKELKKMSEEHDSILIGTSLLHLRFISNTIKFQ